MAASAADRWNAYWTRRLNDDFDRRASQIGFFGSRFTEYIEALRERKARHLLLAGNGCSLLPYALVHCGFRVTVVDISSVANESIAAVQPTPTLLAAFLPVRREVREAKMNVFRMDVEASLRRVEAEAVTGGSLTLVTADILEWESQEPVDAIYDDRLAMLLTDEACSELAQRYYRWLSEQGVCLLCTINLGGTIGQDVSARRTPFEAAFTTAGFQPHYLKSADKDIPLPPPTLPRFLRQFFRVREEPAKSTDPPAPEGKLVCFLHGSG